MVWTAPRTWVDGEIVTDSLLNAQIRDNLLELNGAQNTWDTWSNGNLYGFTATSGTGSTLTAAYKKIGSTVHIRWRLVLGTSPAWSSASNPTSVPLPYAPRTVAAGNIFGNIRVFLHDVSTGFIFEGTLQYVDPTYASMTYLNANPNHVQVTNSVPFVPVAGDIITVVGTYDTAA